MFELFYSREIWCRWRAIIPQTQSHPSEAFSAACRLLIPLEPIIIQDNNDILSVTVSRSEIRCSFFFLSDIGSGSEDNKIKTGSLYVSMCHHNGWSSFSNICIQRYKSFEVFGEDARTGKTKPSEGLILDKSQLDILNESRRSKHPVNISCYKLLKYLGCIFTKNRRISSKERW